MYLIGKSILISSLVSTTIAGIILGVMTFFFEIIMYFIIYGARRSLNPD